jgi:hypothetical protein
MSYYISIDGEVRELPDELVSAWEAAGNPKASQWALLPPRPGDDAVWNGSEWVVPAPPVPESVSARQIRLWLVRHGISLAAVDAAIDAIPDQLQRDSVRVEWDYAPYVERAHPMLVPLAAALGLTEQQVDRAFIEAAII